jgi:hypothetical protein
MGWWCKVDLSIRWNDLLNMLRETECLLSYRLGLRPKTAITPFVLSVVRTILTRPSGFLFGAETVVRKLSTPLLMVLCWWTSASLPLLNFHLVIGWILITESFYAPSQTCEKRPWALSCMSLCPSVRPRGTKRLPLDGFSRNLIFEYFSGMCEEYSSLIIIWQKLLVLYMKAYVHLW